MIIFGIVFFTIMILILNYMRTRVGLDPNSYRKKRYKLQGIHRIKIGVGIIILLKKTHWPASP